MQLASTQGMISLQLNYDEAMFLSSQLERHLSKVESELVHTDSHAMQHDLARDLDRLRVLHARLSQAIGSTYEAASGAV
jgi:hypothetical protein